MGDRIVIELKGTSHWPQGARVASDVKAIKNAALFVLQNVLQNPDNEDIEILVKNLFELIKREFGE